MGTHDRESRICALLARAGWTEHLESIPDGIAAYCAWYGTSYHRDGSPCKEHAEEGHNMPHDPVCVACPECFRHAGRGTKLIDLSKPCPVNGIRFLSIKTGKQDSSGKLVSKVHLTGGSSMETIAEWWDTILGNERPLPVLIWVESHTNPDRGFLICFDAAAALRLAGSRHSLTDRSPVYFHQVKRKYRGHFNHYTEVRISLARVGVKRHHWHPCHISEIPRLLNDPTIGFDWANI